MYFFDDWRSSRTWILHRFLEFAKSASRILVESAPFLRSCVGSARNGETMFSVRVDSPLGALDLASRPSSQVDSGALHVPARDSLILRNPNQSVHRESGRITGLRAQGTSARYPQNSAVFRL